MLSRKYTYAQDNTPFADENVDDLEDVSDNFQEAFFEALKQKGIENYELAIVQLEKCIRLEPKRAILFFEKGKNEAALKQYDLAEESFLKSLELKPNQEDVLESLYDVYYTTRNYEKATATVNQLIPFNSQYKEDLARILIRTKKYDEALVLLDDLDNEKGKDTYRQQLRDRVYKLTGNTKARTDAIENSIAANPKNKAEYLKLIYLYSEQGNIQKAYETALQLQKVDPTADEAHLALYKFHLEKSDTENAIASMNKVLKSKTLDGKAKHLVINDFLMFVNKNPQYQSQFEAAISVFDTQVADAKVYQELSRYYTEKGDKGKALPYLEKALDKDPENLELTKNVTLLLLDTKQYEKAQQITETALELYPSQPLLYLTQGVALKNLGKLDEAIEQLETGVDYVIDDTKMEADFYEQLGALYTAKGNTANGTKYSNRARSLKSQIDK